MLLDEHRPFVGCGTNSKSPAAADADPSLLSASQRLDWNSDENGGAEMRATEKHHIN